MDRARIHVDLVLRRRGRLLARRLADLGLRLRDLVEFKKSTCIRAELQTLARRMDDNANGATPLAGSFSGKWRSFEGTSGLTRCIAITTNDQQSCPRTQQQRRWRSDADQHLTATLGGFVAIGYRPLTHRHDIGRIPTLTYRSRCRDHDRHLGAPC